METSTEAPPPLVPHRRGSSARRVRTSRYFQSCCLAHPLSRDVSSSSHVNVTRVTRTKVSSEVSDLPYGAAPRRLVRLFSRTSVRCRLRPHEVRRHPQTLRVSTVRQAARAPKSLSTRSWRLYVLYHRYGA